jgi:hypothetical protein
MRLLKGFLILSLVLLFSCGDDTPTNTGTPAGTVLFSADSVSVWLSGTGTAKDSTTFTTTETGSVKVGFYIQSNIDTPQAYGKIGFFTNATPFTPLNPDIFVPTNESYSVILNCAPGSTYFNFSVQLNNYIETIPRYVRLYSVQVIKN